MKAPLTFKDRYPITTLIVSAVVAVLIHFPEVLSLSDSFERQELFAGMEPQDVINEILFTFISLLLLFWINMRIFRFNTPMVRVTKTKMALSFFLTWPRAASSDSCSYCCTTSSTFRPSTPWFTTTCTRCETS